MVAAICLLCTGGGINNSAAEVVLDGTLKGVRPGALPGPDFTIKATDGKTVGANLFHSFSLFNIDSNENSTFEGGSGIRNVIGRVTGPRLSRINGTLGVEHGADLWFINPHGLMFGPKAKLDVEGSVHIGTADYLTLGHGGRFDAENPGSSRFTSEPPEAFGFLAYASSSPHGAIDIVDSKLDVPADQTLSVVGRNIKIRGA